MAAPSAVSEAHHDESRPARPEVAVRKLVSRLEEVRHDNGPPLATPLLRGSAAAVLKNPYAGRYVADIQPMMEALKPLGREMAARLVEALGGAGRIEAYGKGALVGLAGELEHGALWHVPGGYGMRDLLEGSHAIVPRRPRSAPPARRSTFRSTTASPPTCAAISTRSRSGSPTRPGRRADARHRHDHRAAAARPGRRPAGRRDCEVRRAALALGSLGGTAMMFMHRREFVRYAGFAGLVGLGTVPGAFAAARSSRGRRAR
jgi:hypothetical protein